MLNRRTSSPLRSSAAVLAILSFALGSLAATTSTNLPGTPQTIPGLGTTAFATSTHSPAAQTAFMRGLLLLHLFEYPEAAQSFLAAEKLDPSFAMAYWGEAMTFNHGVWNQVNPAAGLAALDKFAPTAAARAARIPDSRERAYMAAVEMLYDGNGTKAQRDLRYAQAMQLLSSRYPEDRNAQLFYALALLGQCEGVRNVPVYLHAAAIAKSLFRLEPHNPGAAHYWIHGMDDPAHAAGALEAARALSQIAPDAAHAQHMCSHIFMALGMWDDVVRANIAAVRVGNQQDQDHGSPAFNCGHYAYWLEYGYFQQGRLRAARQSIAACQKTAVEVPAWVLSHPGAPLYEIGVPAHIEKRLLNLVVDMQSTSVIESQDWRVPSAPAPSGLVPEVAAWHAFTLGYAAAQRGDLAQARSSLQAMQAAIEAARAESGVDPTDLSTMTVGTEELNGLIQVREGHYTAGSAQIRHALSSYRGMAFAFGPPATLVPPAELLGQIQLQKGQTAAARHSFELALQRAPGRTESLLGLARAEHLVGDNAAARSTYTKLAAIWHDADADAPGVRETRAFLAAPTSGAK